jgi:hypothetical protein
MVRVLVGDSVYEEAMLTVEAGRLYIEFEADDLDNLSFPVAEIPAPTDPTTEGD